MRNEAKRLAEENQDLSNKLKHIIMDRDRMKEGYMNNCKEEDILRSELMKEKERCKIEEKRALKAEEELRAFAGHANRNQKINFHARLKDEVNSLTIQNNNLITDNRKLKQKLEDYKGENLFEGRGGGGGLRGEHNGGIIKMSRANNVTQPFGYNKNVNNYTKM